MADTTLYLSKDLSVTPFLVPHRDEYTETVGYKIKGPNKTALFIPDIDKWARWKTNIVTEIAKVDYALLDATFFATKELGGGAMSEIPHPFVTESMGLFASLPASEKAKIYFIHFNNSNPVLNLKGPERKNVLERGFKIAVQNLVLPL